MKIKAIDISAHQKNINYKDIKAKGVDYAIVKCTEGYIVSSTWETHLNGCIGAGIKCGAYSFIVAETEDEAKAHAKKLITTLDKQKGKLELPIYADMEAEKYNSYTKIRKTNILLAFLSEIEKAGYYAAVYINPLWLEKHINKERILGHYDIWLAAWTDNPEIETRFKYGQKAWQWGLDKTLGIADGVDGDLFYVDYPKIIRKAAKNYLSAADNTNVKAERIETVFYSYGMAAMRNKPSKTSAVVRRCEKGKLYPISETRNVDGVLWLKHADSGLWSMERDGAILFRADKPYVRYTTTSRLNVRENPSTERKEVAVLEVGATVYVVEYGKEWSKIVYDGVVRYVSSKFIKT